MEGLIINSNSLSEGYLLHWYEITKVIGRGGFGITYLAHDKNLDRSVAIKEFMPEDFATRTSDNTVHPKTGEHEVLYDWGLKRFVEEARTLAKFNHPNIVRVLSVFEENNTAYMIMEYAQGHDLSVLYKQGPEFSEEQFLDTFIPIIDGLSLIHNAKFIHRDIKPANIYICANNSPLLLDFGSARQSLGNKTKALTSLVTLGYAPFEQYNEGKGDQGPWTDIYSLAASIYVGIKGDKPVDALSRGHSLFEKNIDNYQPVSVLAKGRYSNNFLLAVDKALMFKIDDRPNNILEWANMLMGKTQAPELPDYMLTPADDEKTVVRQWPGTGPSKRSHSKPSGLIDAHGKRNTGKTVQIGAGTDFINNNASGTQTGEIKPKLNYKWLWVSIVLAGLVITLLISPVRQYFSSSDDEGLAKVTNNEQEINEKKTKLEGLLASAKRSYDLKDYVSPSKNNAYYYYHKVLQIDEGNTIAQEGIKNIEHQLFKLSDAAFDNKQYKKSQEYLSALVTINEKSLDAELLRNKFIVKNTNDLQIKSWLSDAKKYMADSIYTYPDNNNAYATYKNILENEPGNQEALSGINSIQDYYISRFNTNLATSHISEAQNDVNILKKISTPLATIKHMQLTLDKAIKHTLQKKAAVPITPVRKTITIDDVSSMVGQFKSALQSRDIQTLKQISHFTPGREQFVNQLIGKYRNISVSVSDLQLIAKENKGKAHIVLRSFVDINDNKATPDDWNQVDITVRYDPDNQLKVYW